MIFRSSKSGLLLPDEPLYKSEYGTSKSYSLIEQFDMGITPQGWTTATQGAGSSVTYTQAYESGVIGQAFVQSTQSAINNRAGIIFASNYNYILAFDDCVYTSFRTKLRNGTGAMTNIIQVGLGNTITPANVVVGAPLTGFGNTIAFRMDPLNKTGENPGLITNWFLFTKKAGVGFNTVDTGVAYTPATFQDLGFIVDYTIPLAPVIRAYINDVLVATLVVNANVPISSGPGAGLGLSQMAFTGSGGFSGGPATTLRINDMALYRLWN